MQVTSIDKGIRILDIDWYTTPECRYIQNYGPLIIKIIDRIKVLKSRRLSLKGKALVLNTLVLSKLWYIAAVLPLFTHSENTPHPTHPVNYLTEINNIIKDYLWNRNPEAPPPLSREILQKPRNSGGLGLLNVARQSIALRAKQWNQVLDQTTQESPGTRLARYFLANRVNALPTCTRIAFLSRHGETVPPINRHRGPFLNVNKGYRDIADVIRNHPTLIENPAVQVTCKLAYKKLCSRDTATVRGDERWASLGYSLPAWQNGWQALNINFHQDILWKVRHIILNRYYERNVQRTLEVPSANCKYCMDRSRSIVFDTHIHSLYHCPQAQRAWEQIHPIIDKANVPTQRNHLVIGIPGKNNKSKIVNTIVIATLYKIWRARYEYKYNKKIIPHTAVVRDAIKEVKKAIDRHLNVYVRKDAVRDFETSVMVPELFTLNEHKTAIVYYF